LLYFSMHTPPTQKNTLSLHDALPISQKDQNWRTATQAKRRGERRTLLAFPAQSAGPAAIVCLRSWPQGSKPELTTIDRGDLQVSGSGACPRAAAAVRKLTDC